MVYPALVSTLQLTLVALVMLLAFGYRRLIGQAPLYILTGTYYIFILLSGVSGSDSAVSAGGYSHGGNCVLWLPFLILLLAIYELEGTLAAQRFFLGLIGASVFLVVLPTLANAYMDVQLYSFMNHSQGFALIIGTMVNLAFFILAPMLYQAIRNRFHILAVAIMVTLLTFLAYSEAFAAIHTYTALGARGYVPPDVWTWCFRLGTALVLCLLNWGFAVINAPKSQRLQRPFFSFISGLLKPFASADRAQQSLDEWAERYQIVVENSSEIILLATSDGVVINANPIAFQYFSGMLNRRGFALEQVVFEEDGTPWNWQKSVPVADIHDSNVPVSGIQHYSNLFLRLPGRPAVDLDVSVSRTLFEGKPVAVIVARDVTLRHREERRQRDEAEKRMHSQRLEALGELAGGIAHDFNNLMQSVQASVDTLRARAYDRHYGIEDNLALLGNVDEACKRATRLTGQLLGFAHKGKFHAEDITVRELLEHAVALFKVGAGDIVCKVLCEPVPIVLNCDEVQMGQVFLNLMINSRDAMEGMENKRIILRAERAHGAMPEWETRPDAAGDQPEKYVCIHVRDNGCGMTDEVKRRIFDPFFTTKPVGKGTGMGLPMAFGCVSNHNGWINVKTAPGQGCDVAIFLPLVEQG